MRKELLFGGVLATVLAAAPVMACEGTTEFPKTQAQLQSSSMEAGKKDSLMQRLQQAMKLHDEAHAKNDMKKMKQSLDELDAIKAEMK